MPANNIVGQSILEAYKYSQDAAYQQGLLENDRAKAEETHDYHQGYLKTINDFHKATLARQYADSLLKASDHFNSMYGTVDALPKPDPQQDTTPQSQDQYSVPTDSSGMPTAGGGGPTLGATQDSGPQQFGDPDVLSKSEGYRGQIAEAYPGGIPIDRNAIQQKLNVLRQMGLVKAANEGDKAGAIAGAKQPYELDKIDTKSDDKIRELIQSGANSANVANIKGRYQLATANVHGQFQLKTKAIGAATGMDPDQIQTNARGVYSGATPLKTFDKADREAILNSAPKGFIVPDTKIIEPVLAQTKQMEEIFKEYSKAINEFSADSPGGGYLTGPLSAATGYGDLGAEVNKLKSMGGMAATFFEDQKRKSDALILRSVTGIFSPKSTRAENLRNLNDHYKIFNGHILDAMHGMSPEQKNFILGENDITLFGGADGSESSPTQSSRSNGMVRVTDPQGNSRVVPQSKAQQYLSLPGFKASPAN